MALALRETQAASDEQALVAAVRQGDDHAFGRLFSQYRRRISGYAYALVGDYGRAEDITQEVFISALRRLRETDRPIAFKPWIYEIARNACIDEFRRSRRAAVVPLDDEQAQRALYASAIAGGGSPEARWESKQQLRNLFGAFSGLSTNHHQILVLRELEGLSYAEIAERMGISRPMVESTLFRARRRLTEEYDELDSGRRCVDVRAAVDGHQVRGLARLGLRERRRIASHLDHCQDCQRYARMAGIDSAALQGPRVARKVAALLPFGWLRLGARHVRGAVSARHVRGAVSARHIRAALSARPRGAGAAARTAHRAALVGDAPSVALGRVMAAAAALLVVGGGFTGFARSPRAALTRNPQTQPAGIAIPAPASPPAQRRHPRPAHVRHARAGKPGARRAHPYRTVEPSQRARSGQVPPSGPAGPAGVGGSRPTSGGATLPSSRVRVPVPVLPAVPSLPLVPAPVSGLVGQAGQALGQTGKVAGAAVTGAQGAAGTTLQGAGGVPGGAAPAVGLLSSLGN